MQRTRTDVRKFGADGSKFGLGLGGSEFDSGSILKFGFELGVGVRDRVRARFRCSGLGSSSVLLFGIGFEFGSEFEIV